MGELSVSSLSSEQMERICEIAEEAARKNILSKIPSRGITDLSISVDLEESGPLNLEVDVEITLSPSFRKVDVKKLAGESVRVAFEAAENYMREIGCRFKR